MKQNNYRGEWAGCSNFQEKREELSKAHEEFQRMLESGWTIKAVKPKRPRISKPKTPREVLVSLFGGKVKMTFAEYKQHGSGLKVIMEIF